MESKRDQHPQLSRRQFLKMASISVAGGVLTACATPPAAESGVTTDSVGGDAPGASTVEIEYMMNGPELTEAEIEQFHSDNDGITII